MARIELAPQLADDLERILDHALEHDAADAASRIEDIIEAIEVLERNPLIGRPAATGLRELVIGRRTRGFVALYRYVAEVDVVFVLGVRGRKEAGYRGH